MGYQDSQQCFVGHNNNSSFVRYGPSSAGENCGTSKKGAGYTNIVLVDFTQLVNGWYFNAILASNGNPYQFPQAPSNQYAILQNNGPLIATTQSFTIPRTGNYNIFMYACGRPNYGTEIITANVRSVNSSFTKGIILNPAQPNNNNGI